MADLVLVRTDEHRHSLLVTCLQRGIGIDVDRLDRELKLILESLERTPHVLA